MSGPSFHHRAQALFWEHNRPLRALARRIRRTLSLILYRLRGRVVDAQPPRVVAKPSPNLDQTIPHPAIAVEIGNSVSRQGVEAFLDGQTERSVVQVSESASDPSFVITVGTGCSLLPPTHLESLLMAACAEDLDWTIGGWAGPAPGRFGPTGRTARDDRVDPASYVLVRLPHDGRCIRRKLTGRSVPHICDIAHLEQPVPTAEPFSIRSGAHRLHHRISSGSITETPVYDIDSVMAHVPPVDGPRTVLFLLPYLAVGGAEALLQTLVRGFGDRYRVIIATTDPHLQALGQTVDRFRELSPQVYTLGDWLPKEAIPSAIRHLLRRWQVESLVCWNGNVFFYDHVDSIKRHFPSIRTINQLYNHRGGWIEHYCPTIVKATDLHIAVNSPIARALAEERAVPEPSINTIFHGVEIPDLADNEERDRKKARLRLELGLPNDALVVGSFIRMHAQKRPLDIIRVARKMVDEGIHFLLVGGGSLDREVDKEIQINGPPNLTRLPMREDARDLYDAIDICLMTSSFEGLPVFLLDGLARALPCVAPGVGDIPLLLGKGGGVVTERPGDIDALVAGIRKLKDPGLRREEGSAGAPR